MFCKYPFRKSHDIRYSGLNATQVVQSHSPWRVLWSSALLSPGARSTSPSLPWMSKSICCCHFEDSTAEGIAGVKQHLELWGEKWRGGHCSCASVVFHLPHSSCSEVLTRTHTHRPSVPPSMNTSWPHSSHLLLRPWLTCPPNRKISRLFTNAPWNRTGQLQIHTLTFWHVCAQKKQWVEIVLPYKKGKKDTLLHAVLS